MKYNDINSFLSEILSVINFMVGPEYFKRKFKLKNGHDLNCHIFNGGPNSYLIEILNVINLMVGPKCFNKNSRLDFSPLVKMGPTWIDSITWMLVMKIVLFKSPVPFNFSI